MDSSILYVRQLNRTFIASVLFIDIVGYSRRTVPDQLAIKDLFNGLLSEAVQNVAPGERIMVDTGDGAGIAFLGDPEDALFAALSLRDAIDAGKAFLGEPGLVRMGINLGPLKMVRDINGHTNMIGDGVNDAQRVMSFAEPGQVMVSRSYYDIVLRFSQDYTKLFVYEGMRHDKHVREHEVYRFGPAEGAELLSEQLTEKIRDRSKLKQPDESFIGAIKTSMLASRESRRHNAASDRGRISPRARFGASAIAAVAISVGAWWLAGKPTAQAVTTTAITQTATIMPPDQATPTPVIKASNIKVDVPSSLAAQKKESPTVASAKPGTVKLAVHPWGEVYVNGVSRGVTPPIKSVSLSPGNYQIEVRNGPFTPYKQTVKIKSNAEVTVRHAF